MDEHRNSTKSSLKDHRIIGSIIALALGDAFGAPYEGGLIERLVWAIVGRSKGKRRWTDDTQMTINIIESLVSCGRIDQNDLAFRFAQSCRWSRGYGPSAAKMSFLTGEPSSAGVVNTEKTQCIVWSQDKLKHLEQLNQALLMKLQVTSGSDLIHKLQSYK